MVDGREDWRKAGRSLKGFGFVPDVTACALTLGFCVGEVMVLGPHRRTVAWRKAGRSLKGLGFVPQVTACAVTVGWGPSGPGPNGPASAR